MWWQLVSSMDQGNTFSTSSSKFVKTELHLNRLCYSVSVVCVFVQSAWHGDTPALPVFGDGTNVLPTIHIHDLGRYNTHACIQTHTQLYAINTLTMYYGTMCVQCGGEYS